MTIREFFSREKVRRGLKVGGIALLGLLVAAQFVPVDRSHPPVVEEIDAPVQVRAALERACYDCHSNETVWPAYSYVAPISWLVARDVHEGREHINYSEWNRYSDEERLELMEETWEEIAEGEMPMGPYLVLHPEAKLSTEERAALRAWTLGQGAPGEYARAGDPDSEHDED